jgi:hypothetical protein
MKALIAALAAIAAAVAGGVVISASAAGAAVILDQCPTLAQGYHGGCVNELQMELNEYIGANLAIDGDFGPATRAAVEVFQAKAGVAGGADGVVGNATKAALDFYGSVATPGPGAPLTPPQAERLNMCLASTASKCVPQMDDHGDVEIGTLRDGYEQWVQGAENSGETFDMPGELVP